MKKHSYDVILKFFSLFFCFGLIIFVLNLVFDSKVFYFWTPTFFAECHKLICLHSSSWYFYYSFEQLIIFFWVDFKFSSVWFCSYHLQVWNSHLNSLMNCLYWFFSVKSSKCQIKSYKDSISYFKNWSNWNLI